jgi:hypothetical protein
MSAGGVFILQTNTGRMGKLLTGFTDMKYKSGMCRTKPIQSTPLIPRYGFMSIPEKYYAIQQCPNCGRYYKCES